ncbi:hypothetical protein KEU06_08730 [Pseudaminobacter sp. 19-2017]|uniref:MarR family transcriptional regulator n=1 Tax=Pseudaminobacter soli (ex Zhang et al. 2022) TaxID=2831468 RepID=A0A942DXB5_9HYPH|nr:MarR family transcriptional regulator [Pseudaminobacter soli]MBS3648712.1 hypothetical protein [Pseudaminobacter soli]
MIILNEFQARVLYRLRDKGPMSPSDIGQDMGFDYEVAASSVMRPLRKLVGLNLVRREAKNKRVVKYCVASKELPPIIISGKTENPRPPLAIAPVTTPLPHLVTLAMKAIDANR